MDNERLSASLSFAKRLARSRSKSEARERSVTGFVYVIQCQEYVKIGIATSVKSRLIQLQTGCPFPLKLIAHWPCKDSAGIETKLHKLFKQFHARGEWFKVPDDILAIVVSLKDIAELPR